MPLFISINWWSLVTLWVVVQKIYSNLHPASCTITHHDVTDFINHEMIKNTKTWIYWERNVPLLRNKRILNLHLRWHILGSYHFTVEKIFSTVGKENATEACCSAVELSNFQLWLSSCTATAVIWCRYNIK